MPDANNNQAIRTYQKQFKQLLPAVFGVQGFFSDLFVGGLEALDGVKFNETAFYVKSSDIPSVLGTEYNKGANVAFGTGTGSTTRFGERTEIKYVDTPVPYTWEWTFHEGIDRHTVNADFNDAVADRLDLNAQAKVKRFNDRHSVFISESAGETNTLASYEPDALTALFNTLSSYYTNKQAIGQKIAAVNTQVYNALVDHPLTTSAKNSSANIDENGLFKFKGFLIRETPDELFQNSDVIYTYIANIAKAFTGINTARTIESEDFDGVALQGAGKAGEYIPTDNKAAVTKVTGPSDDGDGEEIPGG